MRSRPTFLWDSGCSFCRKWVDYWAEIAGDHADFEPFSDATLADDEVDAGAVHLVMPDGTVHRAADAVLRLLALGGAPRHRAAIWAYQNVPGVAEIAEHVYSRAAENRERAGRLTNLLWGRPHRSTYAIAQALFERLLAIAACAAFLSLYVQIAGLYGEHGILPVRDFLADATAWARQTERTPELVFPSVLWFTDASDAALEALCLAGLGASVALFFGLVPRLATVVCWAAYLSFASVGQIFMGYQWDALLLEALFVGAFFVSPNWRPRTETRVAPGGRWLVWLLCFKLMFLAGWVKLVAPDPAWRDLEALHFHFWTQPIPNFVAPYADALPGFVKSLGVLFTFAAELLAPLLIFAPRRARHLGAVLMIALQLAILCTGTYGFFNLVALALCAALFDDEAFGRLAFLRAAVEPRRATVAQFVRGVVTATLVMLVAFTMWLPPAVGDVIGPLRTFNRYGLFANMTRERPEVVVEWSHDGQTWTAYDFEYKVTDPDEPLRMTTPHMPRLDWQMWFAALRGCAGARWLLPFAFRLLEGAPEVEALLEGGTPSDPPRFVRMQLYQYQFGDRATWGRREVGPFCPTFTLDDDGALTW